jgi:uncharacterized membrane protein HdeD (DUF308 family)
LTDYPFLKIVTAIHLRKEMESEGWMILSGIVSIPFALLLISFLGVGAVGFVWVIAGYAIVFRIILVTLGFKPSRVRKISQPAKP